MMVPNVPLHTLAQLTPIRRSGGSSSNSKVCGGTVTGSVRVARQCGSTAYKRSRREFYQPSFLIEPRKFVSFVRRETRFTGIERPITSWDTARTSSVIEPFGVIAPRSATK
jgi:hypothetical protein